MYRFLLSFILIFSTISIFAIKPAAGGDSDYVESPEATHLPAMIMVNDQDVDQTIADLEEQGITILRHRGNILLAFVPLEYYDEKPEAARKRIRKVPGVAKVEISKPRKNMPAMDRARQFNNASYISEGYNLPSPFDGKGVVVGVCDIGIDTHHPNFLTKDGSECRIRRAVHYEEQQGKRTVYSTPEEIYEWRTDNVDDWHGTHVTGIAAGAYSEPLTPLFPLDPDQAPPITLQSLAPEADIVFTGSQLSDVGLLAGVEDIIEYAKENDKPAVINLSMGNYVGPHDGTSLFSQYLDMCADDAIICLSSGNKGGSNYDSIGNLKEHGSQLSMTYTFTDEKRELKTWLSDWGGISYYGVAEIWSKDDTPFDFNFYWRCSTRPNNIDIYPTLTSQDGSLYTSNTWNLSLDPESEDFDETFARYFKEGYINVTYGISPLNGRYYVSLEFELLTDYYHPNSAWAEYWPAIKVAGEPGTHIDISCMGPNLFLRQESGFPIPNNNLNVSDLCTGKKVISVGMMNNTPMGSTTPGSGYVQGEVNLDSSYGTLIDGRMLPLTVAPGAYIYSSISSSYLDEHPDDLTMVDYEADVNGNKYYWIGTNGTSMACPFVVSGIATWLQAYPRLTSEQAIDIIQATNQKSGYPFPENPRHGQGWFNAYAGMQKVLELAALKTELIPDSQPIIKVENRELIIGNPSGEILNVYFYGPEGILNDKKTVSDSIGSLSLRHLPSGIHIIRVETKSGRSQTLKVRL